MGEFLSFGWLVHVKIQEYNRNRRHTFHNNLVRLRVEVTMEWEVKGRWIISPQRTDFKNIFSFSPWDTIDLSCSKGLDLCVCWGERMSWLALKCPSCIINTVLARAGSSIMALFLGWLYQTFSSVSDHSKGCYQWFFILWGCVWIWKTVRIYLVWRLMNKWVSDESGNRIFREVMNKMIWKLFFSF